jgi:pimeloyl-ACP methyl ester carboxylesterase
MNRWLGVLALAGAVAMAASVAMAAPKFEDKYARNGDVRIHYKAAGKGPLVVMLHGFPEYWGFYRGLMNELDETHRVAALSLRGYDLSDKPKGVAAYAMPELVKDVEAVIRAEGATKAVVVGHDWGAAIAWRVAMDRPEMVDRLVIMSVPHPTTFAREMATNAQQQKNSQYARNFQQEGFEKNLTAEGLTRNAPASIKAEWTQALQRSDMTALLNYYRANYPRLAGAEAPAAPAEALPRVKAPTLIIHGMKDQALLAAGHSGSWEHIDADTTLLMIPAAGHDVQHDAGPLVNRTIRQWLAQPR